LLFAKSSESKKSKIILPTRIVDITYLGAGIGPIAISTAWVIKIG
jgi:hypothetical protein